jgi:hypothetical protein
MGNPFATVRRQVSIRHTASDGALLSSLFVTIVMVSLRHNAEMWLRDYPPAIQERFGPMSPAAKRQGRVVAIPLFAILLGGPALSTWQLRRRGGDLAFVSAFTHAYALMALFNLVDLLIVDYLLLVRLRPSFAVLPGTVGMAAYNDVGFHLKGFGKGMAFGLVPSAAIAWFASRQRLGQRATRPADPTS